MSVNYKIGDTVYVPTTIFPDSEKYSTSIYRTKIVAIEKKSVKINILNGGVSELIAKSKIFRYVGIAIVSIGDFSSEATLIVPLAKSILQFCRMLLDDDSVTHVNVRSIGELGAWWKINHSAYNYVIFVGHGSKDSIIFGVGGDRKPEDFNRRVFSCDKGKKTIISLCCETGKAAFAKDFSNISACDNFIAPFHSVHGAIASQFFQTYMCQALLHGKTARVAFKNASSTVPGNNSFRLWKSGALIPS